MSAAVLSLSILVGTLTTFGPPSGLGPDIRLSAAMEPPVPSEDARRAVRLRFTIAVTGVRTFARRPPADVCLAIDRSSRVPAAVLAAVREGALAGFRRLRVGDSVSVVAYDDVVQVAVPATRVSDWSTIQAGVDVVHSGARGTAVSAAIVKCRAETSKRFDSARLRHIVVVSSEAADVDPAAASALGSLGAQLRGERVPISVIAMGRPRADDPFAELARQGDGRLAFASSGTDVRRLLEEELVHASSEIIARDAELHVHGAPGVRIVRVTGRAAEVTGADVVTTMSRLEAGARHELIVDLASSAAGRSRRALGDVYVTFFDPYGERIYHRAQIMFVDDDDAAPRRATTQARAQTTTPIRGRRPAATAAAVRTLPRVEDIASRISNDPLGGLGDSVGH